MPTNKIIIARDEDTFTAISIRETATAENAFEIAQINGMSVSDTITAGTAIILPVTAAKSQVVIMNEYEPTPNEILKTLSAHTAIAGGETLGHVRNGGNVKIDKDGKMFTEPNAELFNTQLTGLTQSATRVNITSANTIITAFSRVMKWFSDLGTLAFKNKVDYTADIDNLPEIPDEQIQTDWNQTNNSALDFIKNKPPSLVDNYVYTYEVLEALRSANALIAGKHYLYSFINRQILPDFESDGITPIHNVGHIIVSPEIRIMLIAASTGHFSQLAYGADTRQGKQNQHDMFIFDFDANRYMNFPINELTDFNPYGMIRNHTYIFDSLRINLPYNIRVQKIKRYESVEGSGIFDSYKDTGFASNIRTNGSLSDSSIIFNEAYTNWYPFHGLNNDNNSFVSGKNIRIVRSICCTFLADMFDTIILLSSTILCRCFLQNVKFDNCHDFRLEGAEETITNSEFTYVSNSIVNKSADYCKFYQVANTTIEQISNAVVTNVYACIIPACANIEFKNLSSIDFTNAKYSELFLLGTNLIISGIPNSSLITAEYYNSINQKIIITL